MPSGDHPLISEAPMDAIVGRESDATHIVTAPSDAFMIFVKGIAGFALVALCLAGTLAAFANAEFSSTAQIVSMSVGAGVGGVVAWFSTRASLAER
jgi:hypothetical protein